MIKRKLYITNDYELTTVLNEYKSMDERGYYVYPDFELIHIEENYYLLIIKK